jgi:hypothetical protein
MQAIKKPIAKAKAKVVKASVSKKAIQKKK